MVYGLFSGLDRGKISGIWKNQNHRGARVTNLQMDVPLSTYDIVLGIDRNECRGKAPALHDLAPCPCSVLIKPYFTDD